MTDAVAAELDRHDATDVHIFEVSGANVRELDDWSEPVQIKFETAKNGRLWLLVRKADGKHLPISGG
jgi:hypothetical protein